MGYYFLYVILYLFSLLPLKVHYLISDFLSFLLHRVLRYRRDVVDINLARSFPELKDYEIAPLRKEYYRYICDVMAESVWAFTSSSDKVRALVDVRNRDVLDDVMKRSGSAVVVMGHKGNWELIGALSQALEDRSADSFSSARFVVAYKKLTARSVDRLMNTIRCRGFRKFGISGDIVESADLFRYIVRNRGSRSMYFMIADQSSPYPKFIADFMHQPTSVFNGPEMIAKKLSLPVVYLNCTRTCRGHYEAEFRVITESPAGTAAGQITADFFRMLQEDISVSRSDWMWSHRRWKKKLPPDDEKLIYL